MLCQIQQLVRVGRFETWDSSASGRNESRFKRLTLVYGRNASGKSTIARTIAAAARASTRDVELDRTLDKLPSQITFVTDDGVCRFNGSTWSGPTPKVAVFDRAYIEANVYTGRRSSKEHRKELLRLALGAADVADARQLDELSKQARALATECAPHLAAIKASATAVRLSPEAFVALPEIQDLALRRARAEAALLDAQLSTELLRRPAPMPLPQVPVIDLPRIEELLSKDVKSIGDVAVPLVVAHLAQRLGGKGEHWVRDGLEHLDGKSCPFCAQPVQLVELVEMYRQWFDRAYDDLVLELVATLTALESMVTWWRELASVGRANLDAFNAWQLQRPMFDSPARKTDHAMVVTTLQRLLSAKRDQPTQDIDAAELAAVKDAHQRLCTSVQEYNDQIGAISAEIQKRKVDAAATSVDVANAEVKRLDAVASRYSSPVIAAVAEKVRIETLQRQLKLDKDAADARMRTRANGTLAAFASRLNTMLGLLCADFQLEALGTERAGGSPGLRFAVRIEAGTFEIASAVGEEKLARVLSDGDRNTLAFAIFLLAIDDIEDLAVRTIVFDDPMTSQDAQRSEATAEQISKLAARAGQVIVLSHQATFLQQVATDWRRHGASGGSDLVELELDKGARALVSWSAHRELENEHTRRIADLNAFVTGSSSDHTALRMQGEIRKLLEGHMRMNHPDLYAGQNNTLEPVITRLKGDSDLRDNIGMSASAVGEWDRLCAFGARGNHDASSLRVERPSPEMIRGMARRALELISALA